MLAKILVLLVMVGILYSLGSGVRYLLSNDSNNGHLLKALSWRVALSVSLFLFLFFAYSQGWVQPHVLGG